MMSEAWEPVQIGGERVGVWSGQKRMVYITDTRHPLIRAEYERRKRETGMDKLTRVERVTFDLEMVERFGTDGMPFEVRDRLRDRFYTDLTLARALDAAEKQKGGDV